MMRIVLRILLTVALLFGLNACQSVLRGSNLAPHTDPANQQKIADDTVSQLVVLYPPAQSTLSMSQLANDSFGLCLIQSLRARGYAVLERLTDNTSSSLLDSVSATPDQLPNTLPGNKTIHLSFMVDQIRDANLLRVRLLINQQQSLSRAYQTAQDGIVYPVSHWIYKE